MSSGQTPTWGSNITDSSGGDGSGVGLGSDLRPPVPITPPESAGEPTPAEPSEVVHEPDPSLFQSTPFTRYKSDGRIDSHGVMGLGILQQLRITEGGILIGTEGDQATQWVDDADGHPTLETRPTLDLPTEITAAAGTAAVIPSLPACQIDFSGPLVGSHPHPGGEVEIGFRVPGTYILTVEPFPYQKTKITLQVTG